MKKVDDKSTDNNINDPADDIDVEVEEVFSALPPELRIKTIEYMRDLIASHK